MSPGLSSEATMFSLLLQGSLMGSGGHFLSGLLLPTNLVCLAWKVWPYQRQLKGLLVEAKESP